MNALIEWFVRNPIAANLLMMFFLVAGAISLKDVRSEIIPDVSLDMISVTVSYPGASPEVIEQSIVNPIEAAIYDVEGIQSLSSRSVEHLGVVTAEVAWGYDARDVLDEIKARVGGIGSFPRDALKPVISEMSVRNLVAYLVISGEADERSLRNLASKIRQDLLFSKTISHVELSGVRDFQVSIDVSEALLQRYNLSFAEVAQAIRANTMDAPGGELKTASGAVALRLQGQIYDPQQLEDITVRATPDGGRILLSDIATIRDGFRDGARSEFNGRPAVVLAVYRAGNQDIVDISDTLNEYVANPSTHIPDGIQLDVWQDTTTYYKSRMSLLIQDGVVGGALVFLVLLAFLRSEVAFWISMSVPVSYLGSMLILPWFGVTLNMISLFAYILVLGIVVDEAIVIGENIFQYRRKGMNAVDAAILGAQELFFPMLSSVLTTLCAFLPLLLLPGPEGKLMGVIPLVIIFTLLISVIEAALCLPAHLSGSKPDHFDSFPPLGKTQHWISDKLDWLLENRYRPFLEMCLNWRYSVVAAFVSVLLVTIGIVAFGWVKVVMFSQIEGDSAAATIRFSENTQPEVSRAGIRQLEQAALELRETFLDEDGNRQILNVFTSYMPDGSGSIVMEFLPSENRMFSGQQVVDRWRELAGEIPEVSSLDFRSTMLASATMIDIELSSNDYEDLQQAADALKARMMEFEGLYAIRDSLQSAKQELVLHLKPAGRNLGLSLEHLALQVRQAYHGVSLHSINRPEGDVSVVLRYSEDERNSLWSLENMNIVLPTGKTVPLSSVADIHYGEGASEIRHHDRHRVVRVSAKVDDAATSVNRVMAALKKDFLDNLHLQYPDMRWAVAGAQKDREEFMDFLTKAYLTALLGMYLLMALQFRSYGQPLMVMIAIPFGLIGAMAGHLIVGIDVTIWSLIGMVAVSGIVVNDNLVLIDYINDCRRKGEPLMSAIRNAGIQRARAVILISLTTLVGVMPMILEKSLQAQFMIPMAVSVGFGTLFSSTISLILVPSLYCISEDIRLWMERLTGRSTAPEMVLAGAGGLGAVMMPVEEPAPAMAVARSEAAVAETPAPVAAAPVTPQSEWHVSLDEAYELGFAAGLAGKPREPAFELEVLAASWEAGWDDGAEEARHT